MASHDVMNELNRRGYEGVDSDVVKSYANVAYGSAVTTAEYGLSKAAHLAGCGQPVSEGSTAARGD